MSGRCCLCRRRLGLLELVHDTPAGPCCEECDAELPERDRPSLGAVIEPIRGAHRWKQVEPRQRRASVLRPAWPNLRIVT